MNVRPTDNKMKDNESKVNKPKDGKSKESRPLLDFYAAESPIVFYIMLGLFVVSNMLLVVNFDEPVAEKVLTARLAINAALLILCTMYIAFILLIWKLTPVNIVIAVGLISIVGFGWNYFGKTNELFCTIIASLLAVLAYQRNYRIILKIVLVCHAVTMFIGAIGLPLGFTKLAYKVLTTDNGFSMGLIYPNHVGRMAFLIFMIAWYLWWQNKPVLTTLVAIAGFWAMWRYVNCRTIAVFFLAFLICCWILWFVQQTERSKVENNEADGHIEEKSKTGDSNAGDPKIEDPKRVSSVTAATIACQFVSAAFVGLPFLCMLFTYIMGRHRVFFLDHWHFGQGIYALWMRFISAGILFKVYGFPLFGRDILSENAPIEFINGHLYMADIVDNAYVYYLIAIGGIALIICMSWLSFGCYRAIRNRDYAFVLMFMFMCGYGIIEIVFFQFEHNFLYYYPLTAQAMRYLMTKNQIIEMSGVIETKAGE